MKNKKKFGIVDRDVIQDPSLSTTSKAVYSCLATFANSKRTCFPSITTIAELLGVNRRTVERAIKELSEKNYVHKNGNLFTIK